MTETLLFILSGTLIALGMAGTVVPVLPGMPLVFAGMWLAAWTDRYRHIGTFTLVLLGALALVALAIDFCASLLGAKRVGASTRALWGATLGALVGLFFGIPGLLLGPFCGAVAGELSSGSAMDQATRVGAATWLGLLFGTLAKVALCFTMLGIFLFALLF